MKRSVLAALALSTALFAPVGGWAFDVSNMTPDEKTAFGGAVRAYLMENPEVLVEAINTLQERQQAEIAQSDAGMIAANGDALFKNANDWVGGNVNGDFTVVEFMDYKCGYCKKAYPEVEQLLKSDGKIKFIVKEFPILGPQSELGARFAIAVKQVAGDSAYRKVHEAMMTQRGDITEDSQFALMKALSLDTDAIKTRMNAPEVTKVIQDNYALAQRMGLTGTPAFVMGDQILRGYAPLAHMQEIVAQERG